MPSNPKFEDQPEKVSLDDITVIVTEYIEALMGMLWGNIFV